MGDHRLRNCSKKKVGGGNWGGHGEGPGKGNAPLGSELGGFWGGVFKGLPEGGKWRGVLPDPTKKESMQLPGEKKRNPGGDMRLGKSSFSWPPTRWMGKGSLLKGDGGIKFRPQKG